MLLYVSMMVRKATYLTAADILLLPTTVMLFLTLLNVTLLNESVNMVGWKDSKVMARFSPHQNRSF